MKRRIITAMTSIILVTAGCSAQSKNDSVATTSIVASTSTLSSVANTSFTLSSPDMTAGGAMPQAFTCDGQSQNPSLSWTSGPAGTVGYAVVMHHIPGPGDTHWYWVVYDIPATTTEIIAGENPPGTLGTNSVNGQLGYAPPCSKGPGLKTYTLTAYALSAVPTFTAETKVSRDVLLTAISNITLASSSIDVTYDRS